MIELENGCVCCGPEAGQLGPAVRRLVGDADARGKPFDHVVIELSGVADPAAVRFNLGKDGVDVAKVCQCSAHLFGTHTLMFITLGIKVVTLVDGNAFPAQYHSWDVMADREDLGGGAEATEADPCVAMKKVVELLTSQIEEADAILVNKLDLASPGELRDTSAVCRALNPAASLAATSFGNTPLAQLLPQKLPCTSTDCSDPTHDHSHSHSHGEACADTACTDPTHDHSHSHSHGEACADTACTDPTHDHSHSHGHGEACADTACTDPTHDHSHSHNHATDDSLAAANLGITNFVYRASRPFSERRLLTDVVDFWPVVPPC